MIYNVLQNGNIELCGRVKRNASRCLAPVHIARKGTCSTTLGAATGCDSGRTLKAEFTAEANSHGRADRRSALRFQPLYLASSVSISF